MVAENAVGGAVQGHDAENLSKQLEQLKATSTAQYNHLLELHRDIDQRVTANLAAAQGECCGFCTEEMYRFTVSGERLGIVECVCV